MKKLCQPPERLKGLIASCGTGTLIGASFGSTSAYSVRKQPVSERMTRVEMIRLRIVGSSCSAVVAGCAGGPDTKGNYSTESVEEGGLF